jgi:glucose/arabinose dehydrogenase
MRHQLLRAVVLAVVVVAGACRSGDGKESSGGVVPSEGSSTTIVTQTAQGPVRLATSDVATGLDTPWSMAFDKDGKLWFTERPGRVRRLGDPPQNVEGVV